MIRFFVDPEFLQSEQMFLDGENAGHAKVLRMKQGEELLLCDGEGNERLCAIAEVLQDGYVLHRVQDRVSGAEPAVHASVYMALPKADKLEHVIQKATELGAIEIVTFPTSRCVSRPDEKSLSKKLERWQKIAASAAEQSGRGRVPKVTVLPDYITALKRAAQADLAIVFYENERANTLRMTLDSKPYKTISLLSGPEGGFEEREITQAMREGLNV